MKSILFVLMLWMFTVIVLFSCTMSGKKTMKLYPMSPFTDSLMIMDADSVNRVKAYTHYLIIENYNKDTVLLKKMATGYIDSVNKKNPNTPFTRTVFTIFKTSSKLGKDYVNTRQEPLGMHVEDAVLDIFYDSSFESPRYIFY